MSFTLVTSSKDSPKTSIKNTGTPEKQVTVAEFITLATTSDEAIVKALINKLDKHWNQSYEAPLLEALYFSRNNRITAKLVILFAEKTGRNFDADYNKYFQYLWNKKATYTDDYFEFKSIIHQRIDPKFATYFSGRAKQATIRLDEVRWGGVLQDGIPPLRNPKMINAAEATYLNDTDIVFGISVNGDARAYPKRILAWHEMFVDTVGDIPVAGVYCTLCGTVILYKTEHNGVNHEIGTSGFLYRSNKLMYDKATQSLWSTLEGKPVIGPLVGKGIELDFLSVVTTTWGEWKDRHPSTKVLSLKTGHRRNYDEGNAYKNYFATDDLMFTIPKIDTSLKNKDEILAVRLPKITTENLAFSSKFLKKNPIYVSKIADINFTIFTDSSGAHRTFITNALKFSTYDGKSTTYDAVGEKWSITEEHMVNTKGQILERLQTHNAFWFGYKAAFPNVTLVK